MATLPGQQLEAPIERETLPGQQQGVTIEMETLPGQQLEGLPIERKTLPGQQHPYGHLLDSGNREKYINICIPLFRATIQGDLVAARDILRHYGYLVRYSITEKKETPLHVVAAVHNSEFVKYLVDMMSEDDLKLQNEEGNNAFCVAVIAGNIRMARIMLQKNHQLLTICGSGNMAPLDLALFHKKRDMVTYLKSDECHQMTDDRTYDKWTYDDWSSVFLTYIENDYFDVALIYMMGADKEFPDDKILWNVLHILAQKAYAFHPKPFIERIHSVRSFWERIARKESRNQILTTTIKEVRSLISGHHFPVFCRANQPSTDAFKIPPSFRKPYPQNYKEPATQLLKEIWYVGVQKTKDEIDAILRGPVIKIGEKDTYPSQILFVAAEKGNAHFLAELIREYPDLIWKTNDDGQTIFHIGLIHRHHSIFNLLLGTGALKERIAQLKDKHGNTLLHSVSMKTGRIPHEHVRGASFQLLIQQLWFKRVRAMVPPPYEQLKNAAGQTPSEVFNDNHEDLYFKANKWIKVTSNQCMLVATLITTISFSAAFTIPGGYNQDTGFPMFLRNTPFTVFVILDAISFILSSLSILIFLPISFSRYSNYGSFHGKFAIGFLALLCSVITLMAAFSASFFVLYHNKLLPIIMTSLATLPIIIFFLMERKSFMMDVLTITDEFTPARSKKLRLFD